MHSLRPRPWVPAATETLVKRVAAETVGATSQTISSHIASLAQQNRDIHERDCFNLNPATNVMNPAAEELLSSGIGTRPSLGYPGDKYEMGLEAIEEIEIIAAELCAEVFDARFAEIRVPSGALANLYGFMALAKPGDAIITPPAQIGGHVTHHAAGCAGLYGLHSHPAPVNADGYTIDLEGLADLVKQVKPALITVGGSLNLLEHPVREVREIADTVGAYVLFDAAHQCGMIAGRAWRNPLKEGAHMMTMSTYKSLGGPPSGLIVTDEVEIAQRLDAIAFPGMTANFDAAKSAALAVSMLDWRDHGTAYARAMIDMAQALADAFKSNGIPVFETEGGPTQSHQFAIIADPFGGGQTASRHLRKAGYLACGTGLPVAEVANDMNGLRIGTPELVRWGMTAGEAPELAMRIATALKSSSPEKQAADTSEWRASFNRLHFIHDASTPAQ
ncbi:serine hydroxymethyltransferase [Shimia abyssi]|uniref:Glycine hydroxymethyltransferase n=1 Tax=Shimia abyssi TaxID=1662395 RepID=A0A2P8FKI2_9RHOB|nr:aminotransferase class I/II-fold pyridoxal phosphate-dependent enzyme [Shimia abyssi]PSL22230.1 glycine hydroxymethyltransferase [Shimia abyssi]